MQNAGVEINPDVSFPACFILVHVTNSTLGLHEDDAGREMKFL